MFQASSASVTASNRAGTIAPQGLDDNTLEVGVEWVGNYNGKPGLGNLGGTGPDARSLRDRLANCGNVAYRATSRYAYGDNLAWEQDFKGAGKPGGGTEQYYADTVDLAYFSGHGSSTGFYFGTDRDDSQLTYNDAANEWGDGDMEWIGISACNVLDDPHLGDWANTIKGAHLILGFKTVMADVNFGDKLGQYLCSGDSLTRAWFRASNALLPSYQIARVLAEEEYQYYDRLTSHAAFDPYDSDYYWWTHPVGAGLPAFSTASASNIAQVNGAMPVYQTEPLSLDESNSQLSKLGQVFGVPTSGGAIIGTAANGNGGVFVSAQGDLEFDRSSGQFSYAAKDKLWDSSTPAVAAERGPRISEQEAKQIADQFLRGNQLLPSDATSPSVVADTVTTSGRTGSNIAQSSENMVYSVDYQRMLTYTPPASQGKAVPAAVQFPVVGPGARLQVYVDANAPAGQTAVTAASDMVIGGIGGYRRLAPTVQAPQTISILNEGQINALFGSLESTVALGFTPAVYKSRQVVNSSLGYYELPLGQGQDQLIPVYVLNVRYTLDDGTVTDSQVYIPANAQFMSPLAKILSNTATGATVANGATISLNAVDAATTLASQGFDPALAFALGTGDPDSYLYNWYLGSVSPENKIGSGRTLNYTARAAADNHGALGASPQTIILEVTDGLSPRPTVATSTATFVVNVAPDVYLPLVAR